LTLSCDSANVKQKKDTGAKNSEMTPLVDRKASRYHVQTLDRALNILECFSFQNKELTLSQIAKQTGLNKTTAKRLIANLTARGYLQQDSDTKRYQLGLRLFEMGGIVFSAFSLRRAAARHMTRLQSLTGATVLLGTMMDDQLVYIDKREGEGVIRISSDIGWRRPLHYGMLGMVLMASLEPREIKRILKEYPLQAYTASSIVHKSELSVRLAKIRKNGHIVEWEEAVEGLVGIAAPVHDYSRKVIAALGIALPIARFKLAKAKKSIENKVDLLKNTCKMISKELGFPDA
jgi:IclR family KDG regulon transcriptional repressor